jgi:lysozyme
LDWEYLFRMKISETGIELIREYEKLRLVAYKPTPEDVWTCGWGSTKGVTESTVWTEEEAETHFREDIADAERCVNRCLQGIQVTQGQYDALTSLCFNIGCGNFSSSTLLRLLRAGDDEGAALQFRVWIKQKGKTLNGLVRRRESEEELFRSMV